MARRPRDDYGGAWWHLFNRGIAKRTVFETAQDVARLFEFLGAAIGEGLLEVHAFALLTTHFHLLARSPIGAISRAMQRVANPYVRWFNRTRKRDGPLFRGRFGGRRIDDWAYWETVLRYIDLNAPRAKMCDLPSDHPHASARAYRYGGGPSWLSRHVVESVVGSHQGAGSFRPQDYDAFAAACDPDANAHLVERLMHCPSVPTPRFGDLVRAASLRQQGWMEWKATLADGTAPGAAFISPAHATRAVVVVERMLARAPRPPSRSDVARDLRIALLHEAAGLSTVEVATRCGVARSTVQAALRRHSLRLADNPRYDEVVCRVLRTAVRRSVPLPVPRRRVPRCAPRNRTVKRVKELGRRRWKRESGYHHQARVENAFFRYEHVIGPRLRARDRRAQHVEALLACNILNRMTGLARPESCPIGV